MYQLYEDYCRDNDRTAVKKTNFFADMERKGYFTSKYQGVFKYKDVVLKSEVEADEPKQISRQMKLDEFEPVRKGAVIPFEAV